MSSFVRTIQRTIKTVEGQIKRRRRHYMGRGSKLGVKNPKDKALLARLSREAKRKQGRAD